MKAEAKRIQVPKNGSSFGTNFKSDEKKTEAVRRRSFKHVHSSEQALWGRGVGQIHGVPLSSNLTKSVFF